MLTSVHSWTSCQVTSVVGEPVPTWEAAWRSDRRPALLLAGHRAARTQQPMWGRKACIPLPDWRAVISTRHLCGLPGWLSGKESACQGRRPRFDPSSRNIPWRRQWQPSPGFLPGECHGQRSLVGHSPLGHTESDMTKETQHACHSLQLVLSLLTVNCNHLHAKVLPTLSFIRHTIFLPRLPAPVHMCRRQNSGDSSWSSRGQMRFPG